jgi:hypothetical protein
MSQALCRAFFEGVAKQAPRCLADEGDLSHLIEEDGIGLFATSA